MVERVEMEEGAQRLWGGRWGEPEVPVNENVSKKVLITFY